MTARPAQRRLTVDGEVFEVGPSETGQGLDFDWVTGPNRGYGFSSGSSTTFVPTGETRVTGPEADDASHVERIRRFLEQIDPVTRYIAG